MRTLPHDPWLAVPLAWAVFFAIGRAVKAALARLPAGPKWRSHAALKVTLLAAAFGLAAAQGLGASGVGLVAPSRGVWGTAVGLGLLLGAAGTLLMLAAGIQGLRKAVAGHSLASIVFWFWIVSSIAEEVFCRGWFQGTTMAAVTGTSLAPLLPSAVLFGSLHLTLLSAGVERRAVVAIVGSTALLGLLAAWARATTGSLYPPVAAHVAFNVGGLLGGVLYAGAYRARTGKLPFART
ncbi:MAG TPA: CPBP family intramembrane glutamic endopeptidase [Polyangiaceae bacterium]